MHMYIHVHKVYMHITPGVITCRGANGDPVRGFNMRREKGRWLIFCGAEPGVPIHTSSVTQRNLHPKAGENTAVRLRRDGREEQEESRDGFLQSQTF